MGGGLWSLKMLDYSRESSTFSIETGDITAVSLPGTLTQIAALKSAVDGITLGTLQDDSLRAYSTNLSNTPPTNALAQVETNWKVTFEDNLPFFDDPVNAIPNEGFGKLFTLTIPTADIAAAGRLAPASDMAVLTETGIAAFVTAFQAMARTPYGGTTHIVSIEFVGRNR